MTVWACFDDPALGAISAIKQAGRKGIRIYRINGEPPALNAIKAGDMTATIYPNAFGAGQEMAEKTPQYIAGGVGAAPTQVPIPSIMVQKDNIARFEQDHPGAIKGL